VRQFVGHSCAVYSCALSPDSVWALSGALDGQIKLWQGNDPLCCCALESVVVCSSVLNGVTVRCSVLQCVAVCCSVMQCDAVCCSMVCGRFWLRPTVKSNYGRVAWLRARVCA